MRRRFGLPSSSSEPTLLPLLRLLRLPALLDPLELYDSSNGCCCTGGPPLPLASGLLALPLLLLLSELDPLRLLLSELDPLLLRLPEPLLLRLPEPLPLRLPDPLLLPE